MTLLQALILGILQGVTEFFPVSSSAHLRLCKFFLSIPDGENLLYFDLLCHLGTLFALVMFLRKEILNALKCRREIFLFALALLPLIPGYFLLKPLRLFLSQPQFLGYSFFVTGCLLLLASRLPHTPSLEVNRFGELSFVRKSRDVLWIGLMQTAALVPGISRSGSTIAAARLVGWSWREGARFSFLLAIPAILGGEFLESVKLLRGISDTFASDVSGSCYLLGFAASLFVGCFSVRAIFWIYERGIVSPFAWYCIGAGLFSLMIFHG